MNGVNPIKKIKNGFEESKSFGPYVIFIKTLSGKIITLEVEASHY